MFSSPFVKELNSLYSKFINGDFINGDFISFISQSSISQARKDNIITGRIIDEQTTDGDKIIFLGFPCRIYLFTQRDTASKYIYQMSGVDYEPNAQNEFLMDLYKNKPAIIAVENRDGYYDYLPEWYAPIYDMLENEYRVITDENGYFLFKRVHIDGSY
jgi:hypothetical protein